jgi:hypothetical protein
MNINLISSILFFFLFGLSHTGCQDLSMASKSVEKVITENLTKFPSKLSENSGIIRIDDTYWVLNDGGNGSNLYKINIENGTILKKIKVKGANNKDWEEITADSSYVYIGDFGNNNQKRKDLRIHILDKHQLLSSDTIKAKGAIKFKYADQKKFPPKKRNYDCESFLSFGDSLYLFTKNYGDKKCNVYSVSKESGSQKAKKIGSFVSTSRVTGAAKHPSEEYFVLLSYKKEYSSPYIWIIWNEGNLSNIHKFKSKYLKLPIKAQAEGITHVRDHEFIVTSEKGGSLSARAFTLDLTQYFNTGTK